MVKGSRVQEQYFSSVRTAKIPTLRWSLKYGGISLLTRDENGYTGIHLAAASSDRIKSLDTLLDHLKRIREPELVDANDNEGRSPLMLAAMKGSFAGVRMLHESGASLSKESEEGLTAHQYAKKNGFKEIAEFLADPKKFIEKEEAEAAAAEDDQEEDKKERKYRFKQPEKKETKKKKEEEEEEEEQMPPVDLASWPEIKAALEERRRDLSIVRAVPEETIDESLWFCVLINRLHLSMGLTDLPPDISRLKHLLTLILSGNKLSVLPSEMGRLASLKVLELDDNRIKVLPATLSSLSNLEVLSLQRNELQEDGMVPLALPSLVTINLNQNKLAALDWLAFEKMPRLAKISAIGNFIKEIPSDIARAVSLASLELGNNQITELPLELADSKKIQTLGLLPNPFDDSRIVKILDKGRNPIKELFMHLQKTGKGKAKQAKKMDAQHEDRAEDAHPEDTDSKVEEEASESSGPKEGKKTKLNDKQDRRLREKQQRAEKERLERERLEEERKRQREEAELRARLDKVTLQDPDKHGQEQAETKPDETGQAPAAPRDEDDDDVAWMFSGGSKKSDRTKKKPPVAEAKEKPARTPAPATAPPVHKERPKKEPVTKKEPVVPVRPAPASLPPSASVGSSPLDPVAAGFESPVAVATGYPSQAYTYHHPPSRTSSVMCKYFPQCLRPDCPFFHPVLMQPVHAAAPGTYYFDPAQLQPPQQPYYGPPRHRIPPPCRWGASCNKINQGCSFDHPPTQ